MVRLNKIRRVKAGKTAAEQRDSLHPVQRGNLKHPENHLRLPEAPAKQGAHSNREARQPSRQFQRRAR
jgi:hypothetical protein